MINKQQKSLLYLVWILSLSATIGSLYFSEIRRYAPCILCWYQRILIYPLVMIIPVGILRKDRLIHLYVLPMSILGSLIALYHVLLQEGILIKGAAVCVPGVSCATKYYKYFGFISIPVMSLAVFIGITACMLIYRRYNRK